MVKSVTTSIPDDLWNLAKEKNLKWNECLISGIKSLANSAMVHLEGETIEEESQVSKLINVKNQMEVQLQDANEELAELKQERTTKLKKT